MFILKDYIKKGFLEAIGKMGDYQIILNSAGWFEKGVLTEDDLAEIQEKIDEQYPQVEEEIKTEESIDGEVITDEVITEGIIEDETTVEDTEFDSSNEPADTESETETEVIS